MTMRAIVAEDELVARQVLATMARTNGIQVLAECCDGEEAIRSLQEYRPDLLFLDVQMPGIDGFGVLRAMQPGSLPAVIFTTAYDRYAVRAFEHDAVDYLLKPFDDERFRKAVARAQSKLNSASRQAELIGRVLSEINEVRGMSSNPQRLVVRSRGKVEFLRIDEIDWIGAAHNYLKIHVGDAVHFLREGIGEIENRLPSDKFLRIHRSIIVNVDRILRLESCGYGEYLVVLKNGKKLSLSRGFRDRLDFFVDGIVESFRLSTRDPNLPPAAPRNRL
jgi:two-component system, LytTR family, response regulator